MINVHCIRPKHPKNETLTRQSNHKTPVTVALGSGIVFARKSESKSKELVSQCTREVATSENGNKQNCNPNASQSKQRMRSQTGKHQSSERDRSPGTKILFVRTLNRQLHSQTPTLLQNIPAQQTQDTHQSLEEKYCSVEGQKGKQTKEAMYCSSNGKKLDQKVTSNKISSFAEDYQLTKKEDKVKVTLKDMKKNRNSLQHGETTKTNGNLFSSGQTLEESVENRITSMQAVGNLGESREKIQPAMNNETTAKKNAQISLKCGNHPDKQAKYRLEKDLQGQHLYFCSKCAVNLVTQGSKVCELPNQRNDERQIKESRLSRLNQFLCRIEQIQPVFDDTARDIARSMQELAARFHEQENIINCYFEQLKARIGNIQEDSLLAIKIFKENSFQQLDKLSKQLQFSQSQLQFIKGDILPNIGSIVDSKALKESSFHSIVEEHELKLLQISTRLSDIRDYSILCCEINNAELIGTLGRVDQQLRPKLYDKKISLVTMQTHRHHKRSDGEDLDPFRMSFGKEIESPSFCKPF